MRAAGSRPPPQSPWARRNGCRQSLGDRGAHLLSAEARPDFRDPPTRVRRMPGVLDRIRSGPPIVADGGMGPLVSAAAPRLRCPEQANLRTPETVVSLHLSFINAGAELVETNTF